MSWDSTAEYYRLLNQLVRERAGGLHSADCVLLSVDLAEIEVLQSERRWDEAGQVLAASALQLQAAGVEVVLLCTNTMHKVADAIEDVLGVPFLHLPHATAQAALASGLTRVGLLGTAFTMEQDCYRDRLASHRLDVVVPDAEDRALVHRVIYDELCLASLPSSRGSPTSR